MDSCNDTATGLIISLIEDNADLVDTSAVSPKHVARLQCL